MQLPRVAAAQGCQQLWVDHLKCDKILETNVSVTTINYD
jgi:hypothetical protein